jgi:predicted metal-dependent peptidase
MGRGGGQTLITDSQSAIKSASYFFDQGLEYLNQEYPFFVTHVLNIGPPRWTNEIDTAAVQTFTPQQTDDFQFIFNPEFAKQLSAAEIGFVAAHETMHILLNHLKLAQQFDNHSLFNLSADAVINDFLYEQGLELPEGVVTGQELIGEDCSGLTVSEVYSRAELEQINNSNTQSKDSNSTEERFRSFDDHQWLHADPNDDNTKQAIADIEQAYQQVKDQLPDQIGEMRDTVAAPSRFSAQQAGSGDDNQLRKWREDSGLSLDWEDLLNEIDPDILADLSKGPPPRHSFARRPRNLLAFPDTILPTIHKPEKDSGKNREKPTIVMALDTSGSIGSKTANQFVTLAKSIPQDKVNLFVCTFTTKYRSLDLDHPFFSGGGTSFSAIEEYIQNKVIGKKASDSNQILNNYPKSVIVITDGYAAFNRSAKPSNQQLSENWMWLICNGGRNSQLGRSSYLNRFIK